MRAAPASEKMRADPAGGDASCCNDVFWSVVEMRAYRSTAGMDDARRRDPRPTRSPRVARDEPRMRLIRSRVWDPCAAPAQSFRAAQITASAAIPSSGRCHLWLSPPFGMRRLVRLCERDAGSEPGATCAVSSPGPRGA